jgi:hypothetical protein
MRALTSFNVKLYPIWHEEEGVVEEVHELYFQEDGNQHFSSSPAKQLWWCFPSDTTLLASDKNKKETSCGTLCMHASDLSIRHSY